MAYPHHIPTSRMSPLRFATNSDVIELGPQFPMINDRSEQHSLKRTRMTGNNHSNALPCPPPRMMQPPPQLNKGTGRIFYKTRTCTRFTCGNCRNGDNCNFRNWPHFLQDPLLLLVRPNSIPFQLMVGIFAYAKSREITVNKKALEGRMTSSDARWFSREDVREALTLAEYKKAQKTAASKVEQMCKGVEKSSMAADFNVESGEFAPIFVPIFVPGPFAITHHLISSWAFSDQNVQ